MVKHPEEYSEILYICPMPEWITKTTAFALSALVLLSTLSWSVEKHLCMGRVMDIAFFHQADNCGMEVDMADMDGAAAENHCCDNESFTVEGQDNLNISWDQIDIDLQHFLVAFSYSYFHLLPVPRDKAGIRTTYPPPLLVRDLNLLHDVYLI